MYEENNSQDKPVVIGIDHGFSLMKTKQHIFCNGVVRCNGRPPVAENSFYYDGSYYCIGGERKTVHEDKTADEDFFLLTLVAVAKEIKTRELPRTLRVVLGVGVPFKRFGKEQAKLVAYLKRSGPHFIEFEEEDYVITIENVYCFPQCFAAVADRIGNMHGRYVVADISSWTKDIICIDERKVQPDKCVTVPNSIITLFQDINAAVAEATGGRIPESVVQNFILGKDVVIPENVKEIIVSKLKAFATDIEGMLDESGFDLAYSNILYVGGVATIMRRFGNVRENAAYLEDIRLSNKDYAQKEVILNKAGCRSESELFAKQQAYDKNWSLCNTLVERNRSIKEECEGIIQEYAQLVRGAGGVLNNEGFGNNKLVDDMAEKEAKAILREMHGKDLSEYGFRDACIKAEMQLQNVDKDRSYERGVRIR